MDFTVLKMIHVTTAVVSYALFFVRGIWMINGSPRLGERWARIVPHANDTLLLAAAIWMTILTHQYPGTHAWLTAKLTALLFYIGLGTVALKRGKTRRTRITAWLGSQAVFFYIVAVALTRNPLPWY
ncbi:MAG: SirB2 family protein [Betaproteobacteria bacterium]|nr:SirB2 family protein [Betaproteobacteria bacterium]MBI3056061.1 SirB2 family protein [Betaproteobacteria bacterium]